jgi:hypothetical protein
MYDGYRERDMYRALAISLAEALVVEARNAQE